MVNSAHCAQEGETRSLHVWQLIHDAREQARSMSKKKLEGCLLVQSGIKGHSTIMSDS